MTDYDVLIVGGGLVGGSLALALGNTALRVALIEAQADEDRLSAPAGNRALALAYGSARTLEQLGVWGDIQPDACPIHTIHVSDRGHFGKTRLSAKREGVDALGYVVTARYVERAITDALLRREAEGRIQWLRPARVMGLSSGPEAAYVNLRHANASLNLSAQLVVAADGGSSTVRSLLDIPLTRRDYGQTALVFEIATERDHQHTAYERFTSSGPLACLPLARKRCSVVWTLSPEIAEQMLHLPEAAFVQQLQSAFGYWLGTLTLTSSRHSFPLKLLRAQRMTSARTLLIGNAMHQLHPVAGQGFNLGLRDAAQLAEHLAVRHGFNEDLGNTAFLEMYARARQQDLGQVVRFTDTLVRLFSNTALPLALMRNLGLFAMDCFPPAKRVLARHAMGLAERLPRFS